MELDAEKPIPLYYQLKTIIESRIASGEFNPGDKIPSEFQLCEQYKISRTTVRQAIIELVNSGKLVRTQGRGTFVAHQPSNHPVYRLTGFSTDMKNQGFNPSSKVIEFKVTLPTIDTAKILQINPTEAVIYLERLRYIDGQVMGLEKTFLPFKYFTTLTKNDIENGSLYELLISEFDTVPMRSLVNFEAIICDPELCNLLETSPDVPLLHMSDLTFDQNDRLFEYSHTFYRGDYYSFRVEISKHKNDNMLFIHKPESISEEDGERK